MRVCEPHEYGFEGWLTVAECHGCGEFSTKVLFLENPHSSVLVLCIRCITMIVDAAAERLLKEDSRA